MECKQGFPVFSKKTYYFLVFRLFQPFENAFLVDILQEFHNRKNKEFRMFWFALKILTAMAVAGFLLLMAWRMMRWTKPKNSPLQSLPGNLVQEIADRMDDKAALLAFLSEFFEAPYSGDEHEFTEAVRFKEFFAPYGIPEEALDKLNRVAGAIEEDALLAYALKTPPKEGDASPAKPLVVTLCRQAEGSGILVGLFSPGATPVS